MNGQNQIQDNWERLGFIFTPDRSLSWSQTHAMVPTPHYFGGSLYIYYSSRNRFNQSNIGRFKLDLTSKLEVTEKSSTPLLSAGELGHFDDNGVTPSCVIELEDGTIAMYYIGWNPGSTTRVNLFGGLAISKDQGETFTRWSTAPILERTQKDPLINTAPWVVKSSDGYRMYYVSGISWETKDDPRYNIKIAYSKDGYKWERPGEVVLNFLSTRETALARPYVLNDNGSWRMWVTRRIGEYAIAYAESKDGINWIRKDKEFGLRPSGAPSELNMTAYSAIIKREDNFYMFYNGDNYGKDGILVARMKS